MSIMACEDPLPERHTPKPHATIQTLEERAICFALPPRCYRFNQSVSKFLLEQIFDIGLVLDRPLVCFQQQCIRKRYKVGG